jgi:hypothetical protein
VGGKEGEHLTKLEFISEGALIVVNQLRGVIEDFGFNLVEFGQGGPNGECGVG